MAKGEHQEALEAITEIIQEALFGPLARPELHLWRGQVYEETDQVDKAMADYMHYLLWRRDAPELAALGARVAQYRRTQSSSNH